jgi:hypothetical protein
MLVRQRQGQALIEKIKNEEINLRLLKLYYDS